MDILAWVRNFGRRTPRDAAVTAAARCMAAGVVVAVTVGWRAGVAWMESDPEHHGLKAWIPIWICLAAGYVGYFYFKLRARKLERAERDHLLGRAFVESVICVGGLLLAIWLLRGGTMTDTREGMLWLIDRVLNHIFLWCLVAGIARLRLLARKPRILRRQLA